LEGIAIDILDQFPEIIDCHRNMPLRW